MLTEVVTNPIIDLVKYLKQTPEEKTLELTYHVFDESIFHWIKQTHPQLQKQMEEFDFGSEAVEWLEHNDPQIFKQFVKYVGELAKKTDLHDKVHRPGYPTWNYMEFRNIVKNQWLIHFSDFSKDIWMDQSFKYGMDDYTQLGLTTYYKDGAKQFGGYNFAYDTSEFARYARSSYGRGWKYGKEAVIFRASGVKVWHYGDDEPQVIFLGKTAKDIVYIQSTSDGDWGINNDRTGNYIFRGDLPTVARWIETNFNQYRNVLLPIRSVTFPNKKSIYYR